jgi:hypothetical protein
MLHDSIVKTYFLASATFDPQARQFSLTCESRSRIREAF